MNVKLIAHTQLSEQGKNELNNLNAADSQVVALTAVRTCYSPLKPTEIVAREGKKYFNQPAADGKSGTEADRLIRHIMHSRHLSTIEHLTYTFAVEGVSRAMLAQLTRHRVGFSYSVQSQRYVRLGSEDKSGGFDYVTPPSLDDAANEIFEGVMVELQNAYDQLRETGVPAEDARMVLPNAATCNLVMTANLRALLDFYEKRKRGNGAQFEISELAERLKDEVIKVDGWTKPFFEVDR